MAEIISLTASIREQVGTSATRRLLKSGKIPANLYSRKSGNFSIAFSEKEIVKYYNRDYFASKIFDLEIEGKKYKAMINKIDLHPVKDSIRHLDMMILDGKTHKKMIPVVYNNIYESVGVKRGGFFNIVKRKVFVECEIEKMPEYIEIDVKKMEARDVLKISKLPLIDGLKYLNDKNTVIASVIGKKGKTEEESSEEESSSASTTDKK